MKIIGYSLNDSSSFFLFLLTKNKTYSFQHKRACDLLQVNNNASLEEVESAYRAKVKQCHPDMLPADASAKARENATVMFRNLMEAYDFLCEELVKVKVNV